MVYIEKVKIRNKEYYRLVHTMRKDNKIIHKRKYLGKILPPQDRLEQLKKEFLQEINKQKYKHLTPKEIDEIENKKTEYINNTKKLTSLEKEQQLKEFIIRFTYDSSKLSGVDITLRQTSLILREGIIPNNIKNLKIIKELENHQKGILAITKYKGELNLKFIKKIHKILLSGVNDEISGKTRDELERNVKLAGTPYTPPIWQNIKKELNNLFFWYKTEKRKMHPLELSALIHLKLISLQPFIDGNSRLSRLLMNWILWKKKYPPIDIPIEDLENYYKALDMYQIEKQEKPFIEYIKDKYMKIR